MITSQFRHGLAVSGTFKVSSQTRRRITGYLFAPFLSPFLKRSIVPGSCDPPPSSSVETHRCSTMSTQRSGLAKGTSKAHSHENPPFLVRLCPAPSRHVNQIFCALPLYLYSSRRSVFHEFPQRFLSIQPRLGSKPQSQYSGSRRSPWRMWPKRFVDLSKNVMSLWSRDSVPTATEPIEPNSFSNNSMIKSVPWFRSLSESQPCQTSRRSRAGVHPAPSHALLGVFLVSRRHSHASLPRFSSATFNFL